MATDNIGMIKNGEGNSEIKIPTLTISDLTPADILVEKQADFLTKRMNIPADGEEWTWVDGYKGTNSDMTATGNFQYTLNELYAMDEDAEIIECKSGFHFCKDLKDVFEYYDIGSCRRFFKVRAMVRKKDYEKYGTKEDRGTWFGVPLGNRVNKLVAKKIILERELTPDEIFFEDKYADWTDDEKKLALKEGVRAVYNNRTAVKLVEAGYSETFAKYISESASSMIKKALAVASQPGLSMDMKVFAIMYND